MIRMGLDASDLKDMASAIKREADSKQLRRDLMRNLRQAVKPAENEAKSSIMAMGSAGLRTGPSLRSAIARQVKSETRLSGKYAGIRVKVRKRNMPRGFVNAPKRTNSAKGWRHPTFGRDADGATRWVHQLGKPRWFDDPMQAHAPEYRAAVHQAMEETANRLARKG